MVINSLGKLIDLIRSRTDKDAGLDLTCSDLSWLYINVGELRVGKSRKISQLTRAVTSLYSIEGYPFLINLRHAKLKNANMRNATFIGVDFSYADFSNADMRDVSFVACSFFQANFQSAHLRRSSFKDCSANFAKFDQTHLYRARLNSSNFINASFCLADLGQIYIDKVNIRKESFCEGLLLANPQLLYDHLHIELKNDGYWIQQRLESREQDVVDLYHQLQVNFSATGYSEDASWAYIQKKSSERKMYAQRCIDILKSKGYGKRDRVTHFIEYLQNWFKLLILDVVSGYGEKPSKVVISSASIIILFALIYWQGNFINSVKVKSPSLFDGLIYSIGAFTTIGFPRLTPSTYLGEILTGLETFLGIFMVSLLMFVIGNRINK